MSTILLPTAAQINALTDPEAVRVLCDDVERAVVQIEAQLEFDVGDDDWAKRATNALALFRYTERLLKRRLHKLTLQEAERRRVSQRPDADIHPLTHQAMATPARLDAGAFETIEAIDTASTEVVDAINAVEIDRADEIALAAGERDEGFLARTGAALRSLKSVRMQLQQRRAVLSKAAKEAATAERNASQERRFIEAAKALLPLETYDALWARVFSAEIETSQPERARAA